MTGRYDAIVIGGGHNGLVAAATLAKAGRKTLLLEAQDELGGLCALRELAPGITAPIAAHLLYALHPAVERELELARHGYKPATRALATRVLGPQGRSLTLAADGAVEGTSESDAAAWRALRSKLLRYAGALASFRDRPPPRLIGGGWGDRWLLAKLGLRLRRLGRTELREFLRIVLLNLQDLLDDALQDPLLKAALAWDALVGTHLAPRSPGGVLAWLYRLSGGTPLTLPAGGMASLVEALAAAAKAAGAELRIGASVARVLVEQDRTVGVTLTSGETLESGLVLSSADPKRTFLGLLGPRQLDTGLVRRVKNHRSKGLVAQLALVLDDLPEAVAAELKAGRLLLVSSLAALEESYDGAKYGEAPAQLAGELVAPALLDGSVDGPVAATLLLTYVPTYPKDEAAARAAVEATALRLLEERLPGLTAAVRAKALLLPLDYERKLGLAGGHWHQGEITIDQLFMLRPVPGVAQYRTPVAGLYLCGAGAHPGGHVTGIPGRNAARAALEEVRR